MEGFDLKSMWEGTDKQAKTHYEGLREEIVRMARRRSEDVLQKIRRLFWLELWAGIIVSVLLIAGLVSFFSKEGLTVLDWALLILFLLAFVGAFTLTILYFRRFSRRAKAVPVHDIRKATAEYLNLLRIYKRNLIRLSLVLVPFSLVLGFVFGLMQGSEGDLSILGEPLFWGIALGLLSIAGLLFYFFIKHYYKWMLGSIEKTLEEVLESLNQDDES